MICAMISRRIFAKLTQSQLRLRASGGSLGNEHDPRRYDAVELVVQALILLNVAANHCHFQAGECFAR